MVGVSAAPRVPEVGLRAAVPGRVPVPRAVHDEQRVILLLELNRRIEQGENGGDPFIFGWLIINAFLLENCLGNAGQLPKCTSLVFSPPNIFEVHIHNNIFGSFNL